MTISATTQGIRPGVATSTNRPAVPFDGQVISETDTDTLQIYKGSAWGSASALQLIKTQTIGSAVGSVTVTDAFSATYDNYKIIVSGGVASTTCDLKLKIGSATSNYKYYLVQNAFGTASAGVQTSSGAGDWTFAGGGGTSGLYMNIELVNPFLTKYTYASAGWANEAYGGHFMALLADSTSHTSAIITPSSGTITGGTIKVYGYANS